MESISVFDIFKIGVGPSSSHTLGPWKAARMFVSSLKASSFDRINVHLYGSLSKTGKGHATDKAVILGLLDYNAETIPSKDIPSIISGVENSNQLDTARGTIFFDPSLHIHFEDSFHNRHPNTLIFRASLEGRLVCEEIYASVGGGFVESDRATNESKHISLPFPIEKGQDIIEFTEQKKCAISDIVQLNEQAFDAAENIEDKIDALLETMLECVYQGCMTDGVLPGGLNVRRRAKGLCYELTGKANYSNRDEWIDAIKASPRTFNQINKWISCFALAVNEENASLSRVVTSPTNGAAGVIPAVLLYYFFFCDYAGKDAVRRFLFTAGEIGCLFKKGATISAAVGGCQAEIGVSSAMAAAGLTEVLGGTAKQALMASEIAMEHHLGLTCDPVAGLVQVPCIERNAMGAIKAITASNLALSGNPDTAIVKLDTVIKTMWDTAQDMNGKYKETSEGGLAFNLPVLMANC